MQSTLFFTGSIILLTIAITSIIWRFACQKWVIPWPSWLAWMLENPYMQIVSNSKKIVEKIPLSKGDIVADIGCGAGRISIPVAKIIGPIGQVDAFDIQGQMLNKLQKRADKHHVSNINKFKTEIKKGILKKEKYNQIILVTVLGEIPDQAEAIKEFAHGLKQYGTLSITEVIPDPCYQTIQSVKELCLQNGLKPAKLYRSPLAYTYNFVKP